MPKKRTSKAGTRKPKPIIITPDPMGPTIRDALAKYAAETFAKANLNDLLSGRGPFLVDDKDAMHERAARHVQERSAALAIDRLPLTPTAVVAYEILLTEKPWRGIVVKEFLRRMTENGNNISETRFYESVLPELKRWGVQNTAQRGYYIPQSCRPDRS